MRKYMLIVLALVILSIGCVEASNQPEVYDDTRAQIISQQSYESEHMWTRVEITVLHYEKYHVTCFVMRGTSDSAAVDCFKDSDITGV